MLRHVCCTVHRAAVRLSVRCSCDRGQTAVEYFLIVTAIAVLAGDAIFTFGGAVGKSFCTATGLLSGGSQTCG